MFGTIAEALPVVQRTECGKFGDVLNLMNVPFTSGSLHLFSDFSELVHLELLMPALEGYQFDFEKPLHKVVVLQTTFVFNLGHAYKTVGPVGCLLFSFSGSDFKIRPFHKFVEQYDLKEAIKQHDDVVEKRKAARLEKDRQEYERLKEKFDIDPSQR